MKARNKTTIRLFTRHKARLLSLMAIVIVSVGFVSGIGSVKDKINQSTFEYYQESNVSDFIIKSKTETGFNNENIKAVLDHDKIAQVSKIFTMDTKLDDIITRINYLDFNDTNNLNKLTLIEGCFPKNENEVAVERKTDDITSYNIDDKFTYADPLLQTTREITVTGIVENPLMFAKAKEPSINPDYKKEDGEQDYIRNAYYFKRSVLMPIPTTDIYAKIEGRDINKPLMLFSEDYEKQINNIKKELINLLGKDNVEILSLYDNFSWVSIKEYAKKVENISIIFMVFFLLVTALVVLSTMTRLLEEERSQIACLSTLGYSKTRIISKYLLFALLSTIVGAILAYPVGLGLTLIIYTAFSTMYVMPAMTSVPALFYFGITVIFILFAVLFTTFFSGMKQLRDRPANLLRPRTPKKGKKVLLERIPFIWKALSFKFKSSFRNIFRYKKHFFMTVLSIMGSTILVLAGLGVLDCSIKQNYGTSFLSILSISLIVFAGLLTALVIYNLTNINISERNREIATLMVLGYYDNEVSMYVFREIFIMSVIGSLLGLPAGAGLMIFVFDYIDFGHISEVNWWSYVLAFVITMIFAVIISLFLRKKITKTDMNESLKMTE